MTQIIEEKLKKIFNECDKHILRINLAYNKIKPILPLTSQKYQNLTDDEVEHIDQYLFRFAKLQDAIGKKLFKWILLSLDEDVEGLAFVDILNKMEKLSLLESSNQWRELRELRNEISHQYDDDPTEMAIALNNLLNMKVNIENIYFRIQKRKNK